MNEPAVRTWRPESALALAAVLDPLRRGTGDPALRGDASGAFWRAATTVDGPVTVRLTGQDSGVRAAAWGPGAAAALASVPGLLGACDDDTGFVARHDVVARAQRGARGLRLCSTGRVWDVLMAAVLEQKVTTREAWRSWRELCTRFGTPAPGPAPEGMHVPPDPRQVRAIRDWEWHRAGVDGARRRTLIASAQLARRLERAVELGGTEGRRLLQHVPGVGPWTAAEVAQRAWGDPDAVSVGDFHLPKIVGTALVGRPLDDEGMLAALAPYAGHRHRVVRYLLAAGVSRPRTGPRMPARDYRGM
ncbi:3-methyladenine DNA glycosylase/8-oxoguanine DNA glycosylase [Halopolyspora algeriensis]|uniref:DNA-3-methyladenine glycosylase II n=1 Tax=Halopolyspora algeriensis TaxID=1500506 RepID=A0A368VDI4_9ACTN|nr:DNA-3-methyladenine glycosylase 2 family protein [Halopolyspora algeriensis]RCW39198.1 3-methyladenine DNA glycosylase/8-oxoguanine DNA glycosylase [Halopolyspora algeriensis]TQM47435.1 3-methyladenine DNA glycosylase/8-oxoguanine DNA glycosylase [Halopolyspora algeriensis]